MPKHIVSLARRVAEERAPAARGQRKSHNLDGGQTSSPGVQSAYSRPNKADEELLSNAFDAGAENVRMVLSAALDHRDATIPLGSPPWLGVTPVMGFAFLRLSFMALASRVERYTSTGS